MDAAEYKHIVLGLIFLKYISDAFDERRDELALAFADESHDLYLPDADDRAYAAEERDYYTMVNCLGAAGIAGRRSAPTPSSSTLAPASTWRWTPSRPTTRA